jgi:hypothetical protein
MRRPNKRSSSAIALAGLVLLAMGVGVTPAGAGSDGLEGCRRLDRFRSDEFPNRPVIDNRFLPMTPGTQLVLQGVSNVTGQQLDHTVTFTVTDLVKKIDHVRTRVIYDIDQAGDEVTEAELAFFAQDDDGNVWNLGEYPEEYEGGEFIGAESTWVAGKEDAEAGIHMAARPHRTGRYYLQGSAPEIEFLDCAKVIAKHQQAGVPGGDFADVLVTDEISPLDGPDAGSQQKHHAPGVGIVKVDFVGDPQGEVLELVEVNELTRDEMRDIRRAARALDAHGRATHELYSTTPRVTRQSQSPG